MKPITIFFTLLLLLSVQPKAFAENVRIKTPSIKGKLLAYNLEMTDWQTVISCHFSFQEQIKEFNRYPETTLKKINSNIYSLNIKAGLLSEMMLHFELINCSYKLIVIGKNQITHQLAFGEILLMGKDTGIMSESELQMMQDPIQVTKILTERTKNLAVTFGKEGGIEEDN